MEHVGIFGIIVNLILATWCALYVAQAKRTYRHPVLAPLLLYSICYLLLVFFFLVYLYLTLNLSTQEAPQILLDSGFLGICLLELLMVYTMLSIYRRFFDKKVSKGIAMGFWLGLALFTASYGLKFTLPPEGLRAVLHRFHYAVFDNVIILDFVILVLLFFRSGKGLQARKARLARSFSVLYLSRYFVPLIVTFFIILVSQIPRPLKMFLAMLLFVFCSMIPILWIRGFLIKFMEAVRKESGGGAVTDSFVEEYGISNREREILDLLLLGKSHREIEEELFISYHTVKNHIYNLYQKLGIRNRHQLFHLFSKPEGI
jgi:DNA-binding CsgD family transcriptional regulator